MTLFANNDDFLKLKNKQLLRKYRIKHAKKMPTFLRFSNIVIVYKQVFE